VPIEGLTGMICYGEAQRLHLQTLIEQAGHAMPVVARPEYYF
jgi:hypothetical protein